MRFASLEARKVPKYLQQFPKNVISILSICVSRSEYLSILSICALQNSYMGTLTHNMMVLGDGDFGRHLAHESKALKKGVSVSYKRDLKTSLCFLQCEDTKSIDCNIETCPLQSLNMWTC